MCQTNNTRSASNMKIMVRGVITSKLFVLPLRGPLSFPYEPPFLHDYVELVEAKESSWKEWLIFEQLLLRDKVHERLFGAIEAMWKDASALPNDYRRWRIWNSVVLTMWWTTSSSGALIKVSGLTWTSQRQQLSYIQALRFLNNSYIREYTYARETNKT